MILGASFILTLNISISNFCKLAWTLKEPSFARSSSNVELWSWYTIHEYDLCGYLVFDWESFKQLKHQKL